MQGFRTAARLGAPCVSSDNAWTVNSRDAPVSPPGQGPAELEPVMRDLLSQTVPFTDGELRRLAPVADPRRVQIPDLFQVTVPT